MQNQVGGNEEEENEKGRNMQQQRVGPPLSRNNVFYINDIEINALNINKIATQSMIVFSRVSLSFSTSFKKTDKTYYSFAAKEGKTVRTVQQTRPFAA